MSNIIIITTTIVIQLYGLLTSYRTVTT